jgi:cell pole-organizing protein PopZ
MPQAESQPEQPSMEEILASIRRIIAEDAATPPAAPAAPAEAAAEEVLELTEMVKDDGTVVSLSAGAKAPAAPSPPDLKTAAGSMAQKKPASAEAPRVEPPPPAAPLVEAPPPRVDAAIELGTRHKQPEPKPTPPPIAAGEMSLELTEVEPEAPADTPPGAAAAAEEHLISGATAATSMAALSRLADLGQHGIVSKEPLDESGRTLESLVRELLRPMLKHWLDDHLPPMIERIVREEIQRMARDAKVR